MSQNARSHRKLKIAGIVALVLVVALLGFAGNCEVLFDFALNPQAPYTMKMMQDSDLIYCPACYEEVQKND